MWQLTINKQWPDLEKAFDWVADMSGVPQDPIFHAEGDVATHTRMVIEEMMKLDEFAELDEQTQELMFAAALLHDVEKRSTTETDDKGRVSSPRHAKKGEYTSRDILYRDIPTPYGIREMIAKLVKYHGLPIWIFKKNNSLRKLIQCSWEVDTRLLYILSKADVLGRISKDDNDFLDRVELFKEYCIEQNCWGQARPFVDDLSRFTYFHKSNTHPDYIPFDDTKGEVIMMCGLPGAGKDTFVKKNLGDYPMVSLDEIRKEFKISPRDGKAQGKVAQIARERMRVYLRKGESFVLNATNITKDLRSKNINLFFEYKMRTKIIHVETPYANILKQNRNREDQVPINIINRWSRKIEVPTKVECCDLEVVLD